jgi:hypothetical protein
MLRRQVIVDFLLKFCYHIIAKGKGKQVNFPKENKKYKKGLDKLKKV